MIDATTIMRRMGYPDAEQGYYVTQLRESIARQIANGLVNRSGGSWAPGSDKLTHEERAKAQLAFDWAADHGYSYEIENIDGMIIDRGYNVKTGKTTRTINWKYVLPTLRDKVRRFKFALSKPFLPKNPYQ